MSDLVIRPKLSMHWVRQYATVHWLPLDDLYRMIPSTTSFAKLVTAETSSMRKFKVARARTVSWDEAERRLLAVETLSGEFKSKKAA